MAGDEPQQQKFHLRCEIPPEREQRENSWNCITSTVGMRVCRTSGRTGILGFPPGFWDFLIDRTGILGFPQGFWDFLIDRRGILRFPQEFWDFLSDRTGISGTSSGISGISSGIEQKFPGFPLYLWQNRNSQDFLWDY